MLRKLALIGILSIWFVNGFTQESVFQKTYGILGYNTGTSIIPAGPNKYIMCGNINGSIGSTDIYLAQIDSLGALKWDKALGSEHIDLATHMILGYDSTIIITGYTNNTINGDYNVLCMATDLKGNVLWSKTYGTSEWDFANKIIRSPYDHGYLILGKTYGNTKGGSDMYIIKIKDNGDTLWTKTIGFKGNDIAYDAAYMSNQNIVIAGSIDEFATDTTRACIILLSRVGAYQWKKTYGNKINNEFKKCIIAPDKSIYVGGYTTKKDTMGTFGFMNKLDANGAIIWSSVYTFCDDLVDIIQFHNDSLVIAGYTTRFGSGIEDMMLLVEGTDGVYARCKSFGGEFTEKACNVAMTPTKGFIICGTTDTWGKGHSNILIVKTSLFMTNKQTIPSHVLGIENIDNPSTISISPNPASTNVSIKSNSNTNPLLLQIFDLTGKLVLSKSVEINPNDIQLDVSDFTNGIYTIRLLSNEHFETKKIIINK